MGAFQGDEAVDGSGSGDSPPWNPHGETDDDEDGHGDDRDDDEASGSGMGPTTTGNCISQATLNSALICISIIQPIYSLRRSSIVE